MSKQIRAKINIEGLNMGKALNQRLYGLSQTAERIVFESAIRRSVKDWTTINPCFALALACLTNDIKFKLPDQYQWPEHLELASLYWHPHILVTRNLSELSQECSGLAMFINLMCRSQEIEVIGPHPQSHHMLLSLDHADKDSLNYLSKRMGLEFCSVQPTDIIGPLVQRPQLDA